MNHAPISDGRRAGAGAITIGGLTHTYRGSRRTPPRTAIAGLSLAVAEGEFAILSGPNGSGKTTLFRILCGMIRPSAGSIHVAGHDLLAAPAAARRHLGVVFQSPAVDKHLTVGENLRLHPPSTVSAAATSRRGAMRRCPGASCVIGWTTRWSRFPAASPGKWNWRSAC